MDARKRKTITPATERKIKRRSRHEKSEFVSVEVGMREFKKRLAATGVEYTFSPTKHTQVEDLIQGRKAVKPLMKAKTSVIVRNKAVKKTCISDTNVMIEKKKKKEEEEKKKKRTMRASHESTAAFMTTLDRVKLEVQQEQKERVEQRIKTLYCEEKPIAAAIVNADVRPTESMVVTNGLETIGGKVLVKQEENVMEPVMSMAKQSQAVASNASLKTEMRDRAAPAASNELRPSTPAINEFIADDVDEDLMFSMALEDAENRLAVIQKSPHSNEGEITTDTNSFASFSLRVPSAFPAPAKLATVESHCEQVSTATQEEAATTLLQTKQTDVTPEVLEEMERLRRENKLLRRSNELLQAAFTSPSQANICGLPGHFNVQDGTAMSPQDRSWKTPTGTFRAHFVHLARCDCDETMKTEASLEDGCQHRGHITDICFAESRSALSETQSKRDVLASNEEASLCEEQREKDKEHATDLDIETKRTSKVPHEVLPQNVVATIPLSGHSAPCADDTRLSTEPIVSEHESIQEHATAPLQQPELSSSTQVVVNDCVHVANKLGHAGVLNVSMVGIDEEVTENDKKKGEVVVDDKSIGRGSTVDNGNYPECKVRYDNNHNNADDEYMDKTCNTKVTALTKSLDVVQALSAQTGLQSSKAMFDSEPNATPKSGTPTGSDNFDQTTAPSNSGDEDDDGENESISVTRRKRREAVALSSLSSESESDSEEDETSDISSLNALEAALHAAGGNLGCKNQAKSYIVVNGAASDKQDESTNGPIVPSSGSSSLSVSANSVSKKRSSLGHLSASAKLSVSKRSSLLWPALDDFYDFLLDMSPINARGSGRKGDFLRQYAAGKLPAQYLSIEEYCGVQLEAVMEELVASVSNATDRRDGGGSGPTRHLPLASVSPCGVQRGFKSSKRLSFGAIFSESGFTGSMSSSNDYILTFDPSALGKKSSSEFLSGDLVSVRSPRWQNYRMYVFGVVLCGSLVAVGGKSGSRDKGGGGWSGHDDQICVLVRAHKRDQDDGAESFSALTELCLSNQRAPSWQWSLQQVHSTTTSAREFQAIKAISFLSSDLQQTLLRGHLAASNAQQTLNHSAASSSVLSPRFLEYLRKHYNDSQVQAILGCLGEDSRVIIQGPPGTGKTKTILGLLSALLDGAGLSTLSKARGTTRIRVGASIQSARTSAVSKTVAETSIRVLVAAPSNAAVDELVVRVLSEGLFDGEKGGVLSESKKNRKKMRKYACEVEEVLLESLVSKHRSTFSTVKQAREAIIKNAQIVFCTLSGAGSVSMCEFAQDFDALIIDEAAQAVEASTLIPFKFRPQRVVLVGDHRQLPATVISKKLVSMGYDRSLQQRLVENGSPVLLLTQQYRMHPEIAEFPSFYFYGGRLVQDGNMRDWTAQNYHHDPASEPLLFYDVQGVQSQVNRSSSLRNMNEVEVVVQLVRRLLTTYPQMEWKKRIGVIAPYKQQICELRGAIGKLETAFNRHLGIEVNTVDGFQGREKEIIIYSCVRTSYSGCRTKTRWNRDKNKDNTDILDAFWADERRMNVAITRAKSSLWIVGNSTLLNQSHAWKAFIQHMKDHNRYMNDAIVI
ncbi:unnamed protein product [Peronospora belbahrii]|uniref:AAA+ ATPase domain-containing protein n=1 Tax=Peronospora belbahrii TaxID=622444 RepID=A0AAU9KMZ7_9STRA|nr:unnamed protein product [Peronospora belbahrii]